MAARKHWFMVGMWLEGNSDLEDGCQGVVILRMACGCQEALVYGWHVVGREL